MDIFQEVIFSLLAYGSVFLSVCFFVMMCKWAKKKKGAAMAFGMLVQMFLPDPKVEQTIEMVVESKKEDKGEQESDESSTRPNKPDNVNNFPLN